MLSLGCILISDLVVANLFMHLLPGIILLYLAVLLNQAHAGCRPAHLVFLKLTLCGSSVCVCVFTCVCPSLRLLITCGMIWTPYDWLNKFYSFYMAIVVIVNGRGLGHTLTLIRVVDNNPLRVI